MRILLVSPYFPPQSAIASLRAHAFARSWAGQGADVTVLTTFKRADQRGLEMCCDGFEVVELPYDVPRVFEALRRRYKSKPGAGMDRPETVAESGWAMRALGWLRARTGVLGSVRMPDLTDYWVKPAVRWCQEQPPWDVVVSCCGPYTAHLVALVLRRQRNAKRWVADFRDLWVDNHIYRGLFPFTLRERVLQRRCLAETDLVTTVSEELAQTLRAHTHADVQVVYNGFEPDELDSLPQQKMFPSDGIVRLVYTGTLYRDGQDPTPLLQAMRMLKQDKPDMAARLRLVIVGRGFEAWADLATQLEVADLVDARDAVDRADALRMQRDADALVLVDWSDPTAGVLTGKLFEYLALDAPILVVGGQENSAVERMVRRAGRGFHLGTDQQRITEALTNLLTTPEQLRASANREFISTLTRQSQSLRLLAMIRQKGKRGQATFSKK